MVGGLIYFHSNMALKNCHRVNFFAVEKKATIWSLYAHLQQKKDAVQSATIFCRTF